MDPLVRRALALQEALSRASGSALGVLFAGALVFWASARPPLVLSVPVLGACLLSLALRARRRLRRLTPPEAGRLDFEIFAHLVVLAYLAALLTEGRLEGPAHAGVYAVTMLCAAFSRPRVALAVAAFAILLEGSLVFLVPSAALASTGAGARATLLFSAHAILIGAFTFLNLVVLRAELARVRRLSKERIDSEMQRMRDAARSYRLLGAPSGQPEPRLSRTEDERLLHSGVDEIHRAIQFALSLLRGALKLQTVCVLGLDAAGERLRIQELSSDVDDISPGPFDAKNGIVAGALARLVPVSFSGSSARGRTPLYASTVPVGAVCAVPIVEHGHARGVILADRAGVEPFSAAEEALLVEATRFILRAIENERVFLQLERQKAEQSKLYRAADALSSASEEAEVIEASVRSAREFAAFDFALFTLYHKKTGRHEICAGSGDEIQWLLGKSFRHNAGLVSMVLANRHALPYRGDYDAERQVVFTRELKLPVVPSLLVLPLAVHDRPLGTLVLGANRRGAFGDAVRTSLEVLASHVAVSLENARMLKRLGELATTDSLTGLLNKRALVQAAQQKLQSADRFRRSISVLTCDIDHFKQVNDTYGHDVGDRVLQGFGEVLKRIKRTTDVVGRFGGEEFVFVCEETGRDGALRLAERIRSELQTTTFHSEQGPVEVTCSIGIAIFPAAGRDWQQLFRASDEALYVSKHEGRNRVTLWDPKHQGYAA